MADCWFLEGITEPNKSVKWDAPPVGGFAVSVLSRFGGFVYAQ